jgi:hypothetical protein
MSTPAPTENHSAPQKFKGISEPQLSDANSGIIYYDKDLQALRYSVAGSDYANFGTVAGGGTGVTGLADTVKSEVTYSESPDAGLSTKASRGDHTHGSPDKPDYPLLNRVVYSNIEIPSGYAIMAPHDFEIANGVIVTIEDNAILEIV